MDGTISVLVADDHVGFATAYSQYLRHWFTVLTATHTIPQLKLALSGPAQPDVVLLDIQFEDDNALHHLPEMVRERPEIAFIVHSGHDDQLTVESALDRGASGFVAKTMGVIEVVRAVNMVVDGERPVFVHGHGLESLVSDRESAASVQEAGSVGVATCAIPSELELSAAALRRRFGGLGPRRSIVFAALALGFTSDDEISRMTGCGVWAVRGHVRALRQRFAVARRGAVAVIGRGALPE